MLESRGTFFLDEAAGRRNGAQKENVETGMVAESRVFQCRRHTPARAHVEGSAAGMEFWRSAEWASWGMAPLRRQVLQQDENAGVAERAVDWNRSRCHGFF